jgi:hypothetical protein
VLFWTSRGHLSAAFVEVIRGRLPLHRADRQLRVQCRILEGTMKIERVFRISPALVRVILRDRPVSTNVVEGYLPRPRGKTQFVRLEAAGSHLVLQVSSDGGTFEEQTKIPTAQAEALLQVSEGKIGYRRSQLRIGIEVDATLDRFEQPGA